jgi:hypothetical protein
MVVKWVFEASSVLIELLAAHTGRLLGVWVKLWLRAIQSCNAGLCQKWITEGVDRGLYRWLHFDLYIWLSTRLSYNTTIDRDKTYLLLRDECLTRHELIELLCWLVDLLRHELARWFLRM